MIDSAEGGGEPNCLFCLRFFEELTLETVMEICNFEQPAGDLDSFLDAAHIVNKEFGAIGKVVFWRFEFHKCQVPLCLLVGRRNSGQLFNLTVPRCCLLSYIIHPEREVCFQMMDLDIIYVWRQTIANHLWHESVQNQLDFQQVEMI